MDRKWRNNFSTYKITSISMIREKFKEYRTSDDASE